MKWIKTFSIQIIKIHISGFASGLQLLEKIHGRDGHLHCVHIWNYSSPYFPVFSGMRENADLNNAEYGHFLCSSRGMRLVLRHNSRFFMKFR